MSRIIVDIPDSKIELLLTFLKSVGGYFVEKKAHDRWVEPSISEDKPLFENSFGLWSDDKRNLESIRKATWN